MSKLTITDTEMVSDTTKHSARAWPVPGEPTLWSVTWLPGRALTRDQAITAMTIAELVAEHNTIEGAFRAGQRLWLHLEGWAAELGITDQQALAMASVPPQEAEAVDAG